MDPLIETRLRSAIRDVPDFPKSGIIFKDITPVFLDARLCDELTDAFIEKLPGPIDAICAIESRGFFFGIMIANKLQIPLFPVRKAGKLPAKTISYSYNLEYGSATLEMHTGIIKPGWRVMIHDDLLATGGTAMAAAELIRAEGGTVAAFSFLVELSFLGGRNKILPYSDTILPLTTF
ncbi:MAG: adenine phosphoribosyltransferase [Bacteroidia bacterium]|nr:adenine phosphoribosyltransferase [Bacteroidia bacterium]